jgi:hypothetical protein
MSRVKNKDKIEDKYKFILHFNVDKTIYLRNWKDSFNNIEFYLKTVICSQIWGKLETKHNDDDSTDVSFTKEHPDLEFSKKNIEDKSWITYIEYINLKFPEKPLITNNNDNVDGKLTDDFLLDNQEIKAFNEDQLSKRVRMILDVREKGQPGFTFNKQLEDMKKKMRVDEKIVQDLGIKTDLRLPDYKILHENNDDNVFDYNSENAVQNNFRLMFKNAYHSTLNSFFNMITLLTKNKKKFAIIFRFFDMPYDHIEQFIFEFNSFCTGIHPKYNGLTGNQATFFDGSNIKNPKDLRIVGYNPSERSAENVGFHVRNPKNPINENLIWEKLDVPLTGLDDDLRDNIEECLEGQDDFSENAFSNLVCKGYNKIMATTYEKLSEYSTVGFVDDSSIFLKKKKNGKLILIDPYDYETHHIIFESDLEKFPDKIDIIDIATGKKIDNNKCLNKYLINVDPKKAITDLYYFMNQILACEQNRKEEIRNLSVKEFPYIPDYDNFDIKKAIHSISSDTYLEMSIFPLLQRVNLFLIYEIKFLKIPLLLTKFIFS